MKWDIKYMRVDTNSNKDESRMFAEQEVEQDYKYLDIFKRE